MQKGQMTIYGIVMVVVTLLVWSAINPIFETVIANGTANQTAGTMEYLVTPMIPVFIPIVIIFGIIVFSVIKRG